MKNGHWMLAMVMVLAVTSANAQTIFHCTRNGKKIVSDQPCENQGAVQTKRVEPSDMPPLNTTQALTSGERVRSVQLDDKMARQSEVDEQDRQLRIAQQNQKEADNKRICKDLDRYKQQIIAQQRAGNTQWLNDEHRRMDDELYARKCETL